VAEGDEGRILLKCHAGCVRETVIAALGLTSADLTPESMGAREIVATYDYRESNGELLFQVVRYFPKEFRQRRPDGRGGWVWNLNGTSRVLYRLPDLLKHPDRWVFICEGEKDADRLATSKLLATTNPGGALKWRPEYSEIFKGRSVAILPDKDEAGRKHAQQVAKSLRGVAARVKIVELPGTAKDVSAWLDDGNTVAKLKELVGQAEEWQSKTPSSGALGRAVTVLLSEIKRERVEWLWPGRIPIGKLTVLDGDPGLGKSMLTLDIAARLTMGRQFPDGADCETASVMLLSAEDGLADTIRPRLDATAADVSRVVAVPVVVTPEGTEVLPCIAEHLPQIEEAIRRISPRLLIVDPLMAYLGRGVNSYRDQDVREVLAPLAALAERTGVAIVLVRHLRKGSRAEGALYAGGGSIGIAGAARSVLLVAKDPDDEDRRIVAAVKSNLCRTPPSLAYRIEEDKEGRPWIAWEKEPVDISADRLLAAQAEGEEERTARSEAKDFLGYLLASGSVSSAEVFRQGKQRGLSEKTVRRAAKELNVETVKAGFRDGWSWSLPPEDGHTPPKIPKMPIIESWPSSDNVGHLRPDEELI
jgi:putative DNA primase/helicase